LLHPSGRVHLRVALAAQLVGLPFQLPNLHLQPLARSSHRSGGPAHTRKRQTLPLTFDIQSRERPKACVWLLRASSPPRGKLIPSGVLDSPARAGRILAQPKQIGATP
jgi:hypothetical protein